MKLHELLDLYDLHDSSVSSVYCYPEQKKVVIDLILLNWRQLSYTNGEPKTISGKLIFTGVFNYTLQTEMPEVQFDDDEILTAKILPSPNQNTETIQMVLLAILFPEKKEEVKILQIEAEDVIWEVS